MLSRRPTYEEILKETMTHRLKILPERQKRTQQGIFIDDVDFDDFDLSRYDKKEIILNNPDKGTQTDLFDSRPSTEKSESIRREEEPTQSEEAESEPTQEEEPQKEKPEKERGKSMMRRIYDAMFGEDDAFASSRQSLDEFREEREELRNRREQIEEEPMEDEDEEGASSDVSRGSRDLPMNVKKPYEPSSSSSSSTNRSALLPIEENALSEHIHSSPPISVQSSIQSNRTIEYVDEATPPQSVISSRRSQQTIEYIRSRSSASLRTNST